MAKSRRPFVWPEDRHGIRQLIDGRGGPPNQPSRDLDLTRNELRALQALSHGLTIPEAVDVLGYSKDGIDYHLAGARRKLAAKTNAQAVAHALRAGLIT